MAPLPSSLAVLPFLPDDIHYTIWRIYFRHHVLRELSASQLHKRCTQCIIHGFPCRSCAYFRFEGQLGYGFLHGTRYLFTDDALFDISHVENNLLTWLLLTGGPNLTITTIQKYKKRCRLLV